MSSIRVPLATCLLGLLIVSATNAMEEPLADGRATISLDRDALTGAISPDQALCEIIPPPPARIETRSKYDQAFKAKSVIDEDAADLRRQTFEPINHAIRKLGAMAKATQREDAGSRICAARTIASWAAKQALTDMASSDANLTRDRLMAEITAIIEELRRQNIDITQDTQISDWLRNIATQTIAYYDRQAGPTSRRNNHRYWAGLAVARIGRILDDEPMLFWAAISLDIGLCQVDAEGFLPLELARETKALDYHLFAYIALRPLQDLLSERRDIKPGRCASGLERLEMRLETGLDADLAFERRTGYRQDSPSRSNRLALLQLMNRTEYRQADGK